MWILFLVLLSDQLSKYLARRSELALLNYGGIFGLFPGSWWTGLVTLVLLCMIYVLHKRNYKHDLQATGWYIVVGAGLGNVLDRVIWGGVWDFIYYPIINVVGNVADIWLGIGFIILVISEIKRNRIIPNNSYDR